MCSNFHDTLGLDPAHCSVIHNGVDLAPFAEPLDRAAARAELGLAESEVALVCLARLHRQKNHRGLLEAVAALGPDLPPWCLLIAGEGPERAALEEQAAALGLSGRVCFLGRRDDAPRLLRACDVCVLASEKEGFSNTVVESLAAGLPVVATDVGGNAEALTEGETGFLVARGDMAAFTARLAGLIADEPRRREMGEHARVSARRFSLEAMALRTERLYLEGLRRVRPELLTPALADALRERESRLGSGVE